MELDWIEGVATALQDAWETQHLTHIEESRQGCKRKGSRGFPSSPS